MLKQKIGLSGGLHAGGVAVEQRKAQLFLQTAHGLAQSLLRYVQIFAGLCDV